MLRKTVTLRSVAAMGLAAIFATDSYAADLRISALTLGYNSSGEQILRIAGSGLKDSAETQVALGATTLNTDYSSDTLLLLKCPESVCRQRDQRLTISTYAVGQKISLIASVSFRFDPSNLSSVSLPLEPIPVPPTFVSGDYGPLLCARSVIPTSGACPSGYVRIGIAEIAFGNATACQSDAGGDVPSVQVKPLCRRTDIRP